MKINSKSKLLYFIIYGDILYKDNYSMAYNSDCELSYERVYVAIDKYSSSNIRNCVWTYLKQQKNIFDWFYKETI